MNKLKINDLHGTVQWISNPLNYNHGNSSHNLLCDDSFWEAIHMLYNNIDSIYEFILTVPSASKETINDIDIINESILEGKLTLSINPKLYDGVSNVENSEIFSETDEDNIDIVVSEIFHDFGYPVLQYFNSSRNPLEKCLVDIHNDIYGSDFLFDCPPKNIFNRDLMLKLVELFNSMEMNNQLTDLINVMKVGYKVIVFDKPMENSIEELKNIFNDEETIDGANTMIITNQSDLDDPATLDILFKTANKKGREVNLNIVLMDNTDDFNKPVLKFVLAKYGHSVCYFDNSGGKSHDFNLYKNMNCDIVFI